MHKTMTNEEDSRVAPAAIQDPEDSHTNIEAEDEEEKSNFEDEEIDSMDAAQASRARQVLVEIFGAQLGGLGVHVVESNDPASLSMREHQVELLREQGAFKVAELVQSFHIAHLNQDLLMEYMPPDRAKANEYRKLHHPTQEGSDKSLSWLLTRSGSFAMPCMSRKRDLLRFGSGISSFFKFQKLLIYMYLWLFISQLPVMLTNLHIGTYFTGARLPLGGMSLGNMHISTSSNYSINGTNYYATDTKMFCADGVPSELTTTQRCFTDSNILAVFYGVMDAITGVIFYLFVNWAKFGTRKERQRFNNRVNKVEHYSIMVKNVPQFCTPEMLKEHFAGLLGTSEEENLGIYDVQLVSATGNALSLCVQRGKRMQEMARADAQRMHGKRGAEKKFDRLYHEVVHLDKVAAEQAKHGDPLFAFVTFESKDTRDRCLSMYNMLTCSPSQHSMLRLRGAHPLHVQPAPAPSTLLWENNEFDKHKRQLRQFGTIFLMIVLLVISICLNYFTEPYKVSRVFAQLVSGSSAAAPCNGIYDNLTSSEALTLATSSALQDLSPDASRNDYTYLDCLCENSFVGNLPYSVSDFGDSCDSYLSSVTSSVSVEVVVSLATLFVNTAVFLTLSETAVFLHHSSIVKREMSILRRFFVTSYINVALIVLVANADFAGLVGRTLSGAAANAFGNGLFTDFTAEWYRVSGAEIALLAFLNIFAPHFYPLLLAMYNYLRRTLSKPLSQAELKEMSLGPDFVLSYRLSQALVTVYLIMSYSTGMPILYAIGCISSSVSYLVDKLFFTKVCRTPVEFSTTLQRWANQVMQWALVLHILFGIWMLSCPDIFPSTNALQISDWTVYKRFTASGGVGQQIAQRFSRVSAVPNLLLLAYFLAWRVVNLFGSGARRVTKSIYYRLEHFVEYWFGDNSLAKRRDETKAFKTPTISEAINSGKLSGIPSYYILQNPRYQQYFPDLRQEEDLGSSKV